MTLGKLDEKTKAYSEGYDAFILGNTINPYRRKLTTSLQPVEKLVGLHDLANEWDYGFVEASKKGKPT